MPITPKPSWPLHLHETIGKIEKRTRECLEDCASNDPFLAAWLLDVDKVTGIMRSSAAESFRARAGYYEAQPDFLKERLDEVLDETVSATLGLAPLRLMLGSPYKEAIPAIGKAIRAELKAILETRPKHRNLATAREFNKREGASAQLTKPDSADEQVGTKTLAPPASANQVAAGTGVMTREPSWEQLADQLERLKAVGPLQADWYAYVGRETYGNWLLRPEGERTAQIRSTFTLIAARIIEKLEILPIPVPEAAQHHPHWADYRDVEENMARRAGKELDLSDAVPYGLETVDRDAVDPCTRALLEVLRKEGLAFQIKRKGTGIVKGQTYSSVAVGIDDLCVATAAYCRRRARDEIGARLRSRLEDPEKLSEPELGRSPSTAIRTSRPSRHEIKSLADARFAAYCEDTLAEYEKKRNQVLAQARQLGNSGAPLPALVECEAKRVQELILARVDADVEGFTVYGVPSDSSAEADLQTAAKHIAGGSIARIRGELRLRSVRLRTREEGQGIPWHLKIQAAMGAALKKGALKLKTQRIEFTRLENSSRRDVASAPTDAEQAQLRHSVIPASVSRLPTHLQILWEAMGRRGLNPPKLANLIRESLKGGKGSRAKVDRTTVYRILQGTTKKPQPEVREALSRVLELTPEQASIVRLGLQGKMQNSSAEL